MKYLGKVLRSKPFIIAVALILIYTLAGFLLIPFLIRHYVPKLTQSEFRKQGEIGVVRFNPYVFTLEVNDFRMTEPDGSPIVGFSRLFIDFEMKSLFKRAWTFRLVSLEGMAVHAIIEKDGRLNLASFIPPSEAPSPKEKNGQPPRVIFEELLIKKGRIDAIDKRQSQPASIAIHPLTLHLRNLTTLPGQEGDQILAAATANGEKLQWSGKVSLNPVAASGRFSVENLRIPTLTQFARDALNLEQPGGKLTLKATYKFDSAGEKVQVLLSNLSVALSGVDLRLRGAETPFLEIPDALLSGGRVDLSGRTVEIGSIAVKGGKARLAVAEDGKLNAKRIVKESEASAPSPPQTPEKGNGTPWKIVLNGFDLGGFAVDYRDLSHSPGLTAAIDQFRVGLKGRLETGSQTKVEVSDLTVALSGVQTGFADTAEPIIRVDHIGLRGGAYRLIDNRFTAEELSVEGGRADVRRQGDGTLNLMSLFQPGKGGAGGEQNETEAKGQPFGFLLNRVSLSGLQAAFSDLMIRRDSPVLTLENISATVSNVDGRSPMKFDLGVQVREGGRIEASGTVDPSAPSVETNLRVADFGLPPFQPYVGKVAEVILRSGSFSTQGNLQYGIKDAGAQTAYQGAFKVENLQVTDKDGSETLVGWKSVRSDQLKLQLGPDGLDVGEIKVSQLNGKIVVEKDRSLNLARLIKSDAKTKDDPGQVAAGPSGKFPYRVRRLLIGQGRVDFADLSLPMPFGTKVHELQGMVAGISSANNARAQIKLDGRVDNYGTAKVAGEMNTTDPKAFTDIGVVFRNVEMSRLTPYSGKFAGRKIDSGKLSVDLKYKIADGQLEGDNQIVVERLKLGEKIESPDAVNLPLDLAVALLEDSNGVIELGLPVHGDLSSPEFSFGAIIWKALGNLLTKIVTSPFRMLAALIPGGSEETLKSVAFEPGSAEVSPPEKEKLAKLAAALQQRPQLKLTVQGRYHAETDRSVLRKAGLSRALAVRLGHRVAPKADPGLVDFSSPEVGKALEDMFSERFGLDALHAVKSALKEERDKARKKAAEKDGTVARNDQEDPGHLAKILFARLEEVEPVEEAALVRLADARAQAVFAELTGQSAISAERLGALPSVAAEKSDPIAAALQLEKMH